MCSDQAGWSVAVKSGQSDPGATNAGVQSADSEGAEVRAAHKRVMSDYIDVLNKMSRLPPFVSDRERIDDEEATLSQWLNAKSSACRSISDRLSSWHAAKFA